MADRCATPCQNDLVDAVYKAAPGHSPRTEKADIGTRLFSAGTTFSLQSPNLLLTPVELLTFAFEPVFRSLAKRKLLFTLARGQLRFGNRRTLNSAFVSVRWCWLDRQ